MIVITSRIRVNFAIMFILFTGGWIPFLEDSAVRVTCLLVYRHRLLTSRNISHRTLLAFAIVFVLRSVHRKVHCPAITLLKKRNVSYFYLSLGWGGVRDFVVCGDSSHLCVPGLVFSLKLAHLYRQTADHGLGSQGGPAHHLTGALLIN